MILCNKKLFTTAPLLKHKAHVLFMCQLVFFRATAWKECVVKTDEYLFGRRWC